MKPPARIYKYEPFNAQSLQNLKSQIIYFGSPRNFNDPYDCALMPSIEQPSDQETEELRIHFLKQPDLDPVQQTAFRQMPTAALREVVVGIATNMIRDFANQFLDKNGVTCFSETPDNLLMWSHYAGKSQGFCLEFDTSHEPFNEKLLQVYYPETIPPIRVTSDLLFRKSGVDLVTKLYCTKSKDWAYEREWRAIHQNKDTRYVYPAKSLTGVYFGPASAGPSQEIVCLILQGQNKNVRFYQGDRSTTEFKVQFREFTYTAHSVAKDKGLIR